jgi:hypothetical protein
LKEEITMELAKGMDVAWWLWCRKAVKGSIHYMNNNSGISRTTASMDASRQVFLIEMKICDREQKICNCMGLSFAVLYHCTKICRTNTIKCIHPVI